MTEKEFKDLPGLLKRFEFMAATGLSARELSVLVAKGKVSVWRRPGGKYWKYKKVDAARISGFPL